MIEPAESETYYYHYDALGSVVALSDSSGDTVQTYEYSVYGQPAVEDADHPNPYMFAGRRFDIEIGLYYNRARYYNPFIGRFLQTDPIGYEDGINWYAYCGNDPLNYVDSRGLSRHSGTIITKNWRYWVLPNDLSPEYAGVALGVQELAGLIIDLAEDHIPGIEYWEYAEKMAKAIGEEIGAEYWRTYIEVQDWNDVDHDGKIDDDEKGEPYFIEVSGIRMPWDNSACWTEGAGYESWLQAADAGGEAIYRARLNGGFIPDKVGNNSPDAFPSKLLAPSQGLASPYGSKKYKPNMEVIKAIKTARKWINLWKKIYDEID